MTLEQWAYLSEITAAVAVVASLIYLGAQVRQSNVLSRAQTRQSMIQMAREEILGVTPAIYAAFTADEVSTEDKINLHQWLVAMMRQREYEWLTRADGVIDPEMFDSYAGVIPMLLGPERARRWWDYHGNEHAFAPGFVAFVNELLEQIPYNGYFHSLDKW
jgi:hypothetical protein